MGRGRPVVLLEAGIAASSLSWSLVQIGESRRFTRVCAYDRAGFAWSDAAPVPATSSDRQRASHVLARVAPDDRYVLVGHSFGTLRHPRLCRTSILKVSSDSCWLTRRQNG
jgi:pimeloyl-ACP methyl ester carboxylesterase